MCRARGSSRRNISGQATKRPERGEGSESSDASFAQRFAKIGASEALELLSLSR